MAEQNITHDFFVLYQHTYANHGLDMPLDGHDVEAVLSQARISDQLRIYTAFTSQGDPAASVVVGLDEKRAYFMLAGSHPELRKTGAMSFLWWAVMNRLSPDCHEIDLVGAGVESVARFKRAFTPEMVPFVDVSRWAPSLGGLALRGAVAARRLVGAHR